MPPARTCSECGRPLKSGVMVGGKVMTTPVCKSPVCKKFGKAS